MIARLTAQPITTQQVCADAFPKPDRRMQVTRRWTENAGARRLPWWRGWAPLVAMPVALLAWVPATWPRWAVMWSLAVTLFAGCKWLTWRRTPATDTPLAQHLGYFLAWPGFDAVAFLRPRVHGEQQTVKFTEWLFASGKFVAGLVVLYFATRHVPSNDPYLVGWFGMIGIGLTLHFGVFHLLSCAWRAVGVDAQPLMHWPFAATSVSRYWSRGWNMAFRDLMHRFAFRPLTPLVGPRGALVAVFVISGLVHDLVISLPAGGGWGWPSGYFGVQCLGVLVERSAVGRRLGLGRGAGGWLFTLLVVVLPAPLLFHGPFVYGVVLPFLQTIGAIS